MGFAIRTEVFDGPLDLLLHIVERDGVDLRQVRIAPIADAYLEWLDRMRDLSLSVAAEYLVMAATLCYLKSLELLPRAPTATSPEAVEEDPRAALLAKLVEHQRYREAADALDARSMLGRDAFAREPEAVDSDAPAPVVAGIDAFRLLDLYHAMLRKQAEQEPVHTIGRSGPDIGACCRHVLARLGGQGGRATLDEVLASIRMRVERILVFLAVLEMARLGWVGIDQAEHLGPVELLSRVAVDVDLSPIVGRIELVEREIA